MEFFDKLGKKASEAYKYTADKTGKLAKETKLKLKMGELKGEVNDLYQEIGKKVYEKHVREENIEIKGELEELCTKIDVVSDEIESLLKQCIELRDKKQCPNCHTEIEKDDKYCRECGIKQEELKSSEVKENSEELIQSQDFKEIENVNNRQSNTGNNESNIEKTTEVEIDSKLNGNESEKEVVENFMESEQEDSNFEVHDEENEFLEE